MVTIVDALKALRGSKESRLEDKVVQNLPSFERIVTGVSEVQLDGVRAALRLRYCPAIAQVGVSGRS